MNDFLISNLNLNVSLNFKKIFGYYFYSNKKINFLKINNSYFIFGQIYKKLNNRSLVLDSTYDGRYCLVVIKNENIRVNIDQFSRLDVFYAQEKTIFLFHLILTKLLKIYQARLLIK